jgi:hypothetical protein
MAPALFGAIDRVDQKAADALEQLVGLVRGRRDRTPDAEPWLKGRAATAWNLMLRYSPPSVVRGHIQSASRSTLDQSREHARWLIYELPAFVRALEAQFGSGFGGLAVFSRAAASLAPAMCTATIALDRFPPARKRLDLLIRALAPHGAIRDAVVEIDGAYRAQHPDQQRLLGRIGIQGLVDRGLARPLIGYDDLLARAEELALHEASSAGGGP